MEELMLIFSTLPVLRAVCMKYEVFQDFIFYF